MVSSLRRLVMFRYLVPYIYILIHTYTMYTNRMLCMSVCVLCGSPVWPSPPVVGPLCPIPLCVDPL